MKSTDGDVVKIFSSLCNISRVVSVTLASCRIRSSMKICETIGVVWQKFVMTLFGLKCFHLIGCAVNSDGIDRGQVCFFLGL